MTLDLLLFIAISLAIVHFGVPLAYYYYLKRLWLNKPWDIKRNPSYKPKVSIIVPTYNEANLIESKLNDLARQDYSRDLLEIIVVDSASTDGTPELVKKWAKNHSDILIKLIEEPERRGMAHALHTGFKYAEGDVIIVTDADALWTNKETLKEIVELFSDTSIGAISCIKVPMGGGAIESVYRNYYNILRVAESKAWSTPIFHGELSAFRRELLEKTGGFPLGIGSAESLAAMRIAALGYRAIIPDTVVVQELIPKNNYIQWRIRRAQHLILHLVKTLALLRNYNNNIFKGIVLMEMYLHIVNPWFLLASLMLLVYSILVLQSVLGLSIVIIGIMLLVLNPYRTWVVNQALLILAQIRNLWNRELVWKKQEKSAR